ncbi:taste receptor type 2 member 39-like [Leptodactylus fuscus]|uniref:taste receptor type 2 member 39-like n=1 Tax=Leptodactylus fuscus TaxID=238119 RepID=UPI003F4EEBC2
MSDIHPILAVVIHAVLFLIGFIENVFILVIHFLDWLKTHELNPCDLIIACIVLSNIFLQATVLANVVFYFLFLVIYAQVSVINVLSATMASLAFSSLCCSTCLCYYYCVKIVSLSGACFHKLKSTLPLMVPWLLAFCVALSWAVGLPAYWDIYRTTVDPVSNSSSNGTLDFTLSIQSRCKCLFQIYTVVSAVAFTVIFITAGTLISSLCLHMRRMKQNSESSGCSKVRSHLSAARTVTLLLISYLVFYGALSTIFNETTEIGTVLFSLCFIVVSGFPVINAVILITGNRKLSNALREIFGIKSGTETANSEANVS